MLQQLGYAGVLPFVLLPAISLGWPVVSVAQATLLFQFYSCLILAFMAGVFWPVLYQPKRPSGRALAAVSFPILAFLSIALIPTYAIMVLAVLFIALRAYESYAGLWQLYELSYQTLRNRLTLIVLICHGWFIFGVA